MRENDQLKFDANHTSEVLKPLWHEPLEGWKMSDKKRGKRACCCVLYHKFIYEEGLLLAEKSRLDRQIHAVAISVQTSMRIISCAVNVHAGCRWVEYRGWISGRM